MRRSGITAILAVLLLAACGGGGSEESAPSVKVVGASLADSGTYGYKFTVQPAGATTYPVYSEGVAMAYGTTGFCSYYTYNFSGGTFSTHSGCTNYAVAGAKVNNYYDSTYGVVEIYPDSAIKQLQDVGNAGFTSRDLLLVGEASSNDAAALTEAYLTSPTTDFPALLATLVSSTDLATHAGDSAALGTLYMQALADKLMAAVETNALNKGATRIAIVNTLDITMTPRFQKTLDDIATLYGQTAADQTQALVRIWIQAYNDRLEANVATHSSNVVVVDLYTEFNTRASAPATYGLTDTTNTVCDEIVTGGTAPGVTTLNSAAVVSACTDTAATALNLGGTADGWNTFLFADNFHPTPYGHQLLEDIVTQRLITAGWM